MSMTTLHLEVITPQRTVLSAQVSDLQFPSLTKGYYGILPTHTPLMTPLNNGVIYFSIGNQKRMVTVFGGFAEVGPDRVTILAQESETEDQIDFKAAEVECQQALKLLQDSPNEDSLRTAQALLDRARIRMECSGRTASH